MAETKAKIVRKGGSTSDDPVFAFFIDDIRGPYVYYRTYSVWTKTSSVGRDVRKPDYVKHDVFERALTLLGWTSNHPTGSTMPIAEWVLINSDYARTRLSPMLESRECVVSALGLFWDIKLPRWRAVSRRTSHLRPQILARDHFQCVKCGRGEADGIILTLDHVIPYSRGGETTAGNIITLCEPCNQGYGGDHHPHLFALAGLHHGWDPQLMTARAIRDPDTRLYAAHLSHNIMVSRCQTVNLPVKFC
jgi:hypothetical protein